MSKKIFVSILLVISLFLCGCSSKPKDFLEYQKSNFSSEATLEINSEKYSVSIEKTGDDTYKITFLSPENMKGVFVEKNGGSIVYSVGSVSIPMESGTNLIADMTEVFNLTKENLVSEKDEMFNGVKVNTKRFNSDSGYTVVYTSAEKSLPVRIETIMNGNEINISFSNFQTITE